MCTAKQPEWAEEIAWNELYDSYQGGLTEDLRREV